MLLGIDQGTTGTTVIAFDDDLRPVARAYRRLESQHPHPGWVEQRPQDILSGVTEAVGEVLSKIGGPRAVRTAGLTNQGESVLAWDANTGRALTPVIVWSDRRASGLIERLRLDGHAPRVRALTGLELSDYFCAAKFKWLLEHDEPVRLARLEGSLRLSTLDTWMALHLGRIAHATDHSTASRTQLYNLERGGWDDELLEVFGVPPETLPEIRRSCGDWGALEHPNWGGPIPWRASLVDQPAALVGNGCVTPGAMKITYGTGCFALVNAGTAVPSAGSGLLASVAWSRDGAGLDEAGLDEAGLDKAGLERSFALDGGVFTAGTAIEWLVGLGLVASAAETSDLAQGASESPVRFLPAFTGLGAPWWDPQARGVFAGLTAGTTRAHMVKAVLDGIAFRVTDIAHAIWNGGTAVPSSIRVDGGLSANAYLMQRQADLLGVPLEVGVQSEATALGAAMLAGNVMESPANMSSLTFEPRLAPDLREQQYSGWRDWLERAQALGK